MNLFSWSLVWLKDKDNFLMTGSFQSVLGRCAGWPLSPHGENGKDDLWWLRSTCKAQICDGVRDRRSYGHYHKQILSKVYLHRHLQYAEAHMYLPSLPPLFDTLSFSWLGSVSSSHLHQCDLSTSRLSESEEKKVKGLVPNICRNATDGRRRHDSWPVVVSH